MAEPSTLPVLNQTPSTDSQSLEEKYDEKNESSTPEIAIGTYEVDGIYDIKVSFRFSLSFFLPLTRVEQRLQLSY